jgi:propionyl-CoA carboxylase alpha chain
MRFNSILVANRGEIACRIMQTAQFMGIKCIAVFVDADKDAPFVKMADEAIKLSSGYMDGSAIIDAAIQSGAEAIHPGYGFLSENAVFC